MIDFSEIREKTNSLQKQIHSIDENDTYISDGVYAPISSTYSLWRNVNLKGVIDIQPKNNQAKMEYTLNHDLYPDTAIEEIIVGLYIPDINVKEEFKNTVRIRERKSKSDFFEKCKIGKYCAFDSHTIKWYERFYHNIKNSDNRKERWSRCISARTEYIIHPWPFTLNKRNSILLEEDVKIVYKVVFSIWNMIKMCVKEGDSWVRKEKTKYLEYGDWMIPCDLCIRLRHYLPEEVSTMVIPDHKISYDTCVQKTNKWFKITGTKGILLLGFTVFFPEGLQDDSLSMKVDSKIYMEDIPLVMFSRFSQYTKCTSNKEGIYSCLFCNLFGVKGHPTLNSINLENSVEILVSGIESSVTVQYITLNF